MFKIERSNYLGAAGVRPAGAAAPSPVGAFAAGAERPGGMTGIDAGGGLTSAGVQPARNAAADSTKVPKRIRRIIELSKCA